MIKSQSEPSSIRYYNAATTVVCLGIKRSISETSKYIKNELEVPNTDKIVGHSWEQARFLFKLWWIGPLPVTKYPPDNREKPYERQTTVNVVCVDRSVFYPDLKEMSIRYYEQFFI